jgi:hypothetical protein
VTRAQTIPLCLLAALLPAFPAAARAGEPAAPVPAAAPTAVRFGALDGSFLQPTTSRFKILQTTAEGKTVEWGSSTYEVTIVEHGGRQAVRRVQVTTTPKRTITDVGIADRETLRPLSSEESDSLGLFEHFDFAPGRVTLEKAGEGGARTRTDIELSAPVYDFLGGVYDLIVAALPHAEGAVLELPVYSQTDRKAGTQTFKVHGRETLDDGTGKRIETWKVETGIKAFRVFFWVTKTPPYLLRLENHGPGGGRQIFERAGD